MLPLRSEPAARIFVMSLTCGFILATQCPGAEIRTAPASTTAALPASVNNNAPPTPPPPSAKPAFQIENTFERTLDVEEAPPMHGLPPVAGEIKLRVHQVANPGLPDPPVRSPQTDAPGLSEGSNEVSGETPETRETHIAFISATVYDRSRTLLTYRPDGGAGDAVTVWSNIDFNHFSGLGSFEATSGDGVTRDYMLIMGIGNETTEPRRVSTDADDAEYEAPEVPKIPDLPEGTPAFVVMTGHPDPATLTLIEDMHALYRAEGTRMAELAAAREAGQRARRAHYLENPPVPEDVTIHFWNRKPATSP